MALKIHLDAGHYAYFNNSPANKNYWESIQMWKLQNLLKAYLEEYGVKVTTTRSDQKKDMEVYARGQSAKGCDLLISLHSNAVGSYVHEATDYVAVFVPANKSVDELGKKLANAVSKTMGTKQGGSIRYRQQNDGQDYYGVIRGAVSVGVPGIIIEHSFHTNTRSTEWLLNESNLSKLAKAEAEAIAEHYGLSTQISKPNYENIGKAVIKAVEDINNLASVKALKELLK